MNKIKKIENKYGKEKSGSIKNTIKFLNKAGYSSLSNLINNNYEQNL